jgi:hypothetical protein
MAETILNAKRVRLMQAAPNSNTKPGDIGFDWNAANVSGLTVSTNGFAKCVVGGRTLIATFAWAELEDGSEWDNLGAHTCPECGQSFVNSQGLGNHRAMKHPQPKAIGAKRG